MSRVFVSQWPDLFIVAGLRDFHVRNSRPKLAGACFFLVINCVYSLVLWYIFPLSCLHMVMKKRHIDDSRALWLEGTAVDIVPITSFDINNPMAEAVETDVFYTFLFVSIIKMNSATHFRDCSSCLSFSFNTRPLSLESIHKYWLIPWSGAGHLVHFHPY